MSPAIACWANAIGACDATERIEWETFRHEVDDFLRWLRRFIELRQKRFPVHRESFPYVA